MMHKPCRDSISPARLVQNKTEFTKQTQQPGFGLRQCLRDAGAMSPDAHLLAHRCFNQHFS
jgi:hypothetical protein